MNKAGLIGAYAVAFLLKPVIDGILPGHTGNGNLVLCLTTVLVFLFDEYVPVITGGIAFALLDDLVYGLYCGPEALGTLAVCLAVIGFKYFFNNENYVNAFVVALVSTWLAGSVEWAVYRAAGATYTYGFAMKALLGSIAVNAVVGMIGYCIIYSRIRKKKYNKLYR